MPTNNSSNPDHELIDDAQKAGVATDYQSGSSQSSPKTLKHKSGCFKGCLVTIIVTLISIISFIIYIQPKEVTDPEEASKMFGEMLKKVHPDFIGLPEDNYPNRSLIGLISTKLYLGRIGALIISRFSCQRYLLNIKTITLV